MATEATKSKTLGEMMLRVALRLGVQEYDATGRAVLPNDQDRLDICKQSVNDALVRVMKAHDWTAMRPFLTVSMNPIADADSVDGETWRKRLPAGYQSRPVSDWTINDQLAVQPVKDTHASEVLRRRAHLGTHTDLPSIAAVRPMDESETTRGGRWELMVYPDPDRAYTMTAQFRLQPFRLNELDDVHPLGIIHDETIESCAEWLASRRYGEQGPDLQLLEAQYREEMALSIQADTRSETRNKGIMVDPAMDIYSHDSDYYGQHPFKPGLLSYDGSIIT